MKSWSVKAWKKIVITCVVGLLVTVFVIPPVLLLFIYSYAGTSYSSDNLANKATILHNLKFLEVLVHINMALAFLFGLGVVVSLICYIHLAKRN
jgi:ABC-type sulfate transport system permease subunit